MAFIFCPHCGCKAEYKFSAPNFCHKCGLPYNSGTSAVQKHRQLSRSKRLRDEDLEEEPEDIENEDDTGESYFSNSTRVPRISRLNVDVEMSSDVRVVKFSDLISPNYEATKFPRGRTQSLSDFSDE
jgi:hypothetical protein